MCVLFLVIICSWGVMTRSKQDLPQLNITTRDVKNVTYDTNHFKTMKPTPIPPKDYICVTTLDGTTFENMRPGLV